MNSYVKYKIGDRVFAKVKHYPYWPAIIADIDELKNKIKKYKVVFYGTKEIGYVKESDICLFLENKSKYGIQKQKNAKFNIALKEAEISFNSCETRQKRKLKIVNSFLKSDESVTNSTFNLSEFPSMISSPTLQPTPVTPVIPSHTATQESKEAIPTDKLSSLNKVKTLLGPNWLTDDIVWDYFDLLNNTILRESRLICMNPIICQAIKILNDFSDILNPLNLKTAKYLFMPVNDSSNADSEGGTHWSLLLYEKSTSKFYYYDSIKGYNLGQAKVIAKKLHNHLNDTTTEEPNIIEVFTPQQKNSFDCGIYMLHLTDTILDKILSSNIGDRLTQQYNFGEFTEFDIISKRSVMAYLLLNKNVVSTKTVASLIWKSNLGCSLTKREEAPINLKEKTNEWKIAKFGPQGKNTHVYTHTSFENTNRFAPLAQHSAMEQDIAYPSTGQSIQKRPSCKKKAQPKRHKVLLLADSHGRKCRGLLQDNLGKHFGVAAIIKPNASLEGVVSDAKSLTASFTRKDYVVVMGGTNHLFDCNGKQTELNLSFIESLAENTNVLMAGIPKRFDVPSFNDAVKIANDTIYKYTRHLNTSKDSVLLVDKCVITRQDHTKHGLHLRRAGKVKLCAAFSQTILRDIKRKGLSIDFPTPTPSDCIASPPSNVYEPSMLVPTMSSGNTQAIASLSPLNQSTPIRDRMVPLCPQTEPKEVVNINRLDSDVNSFSVNSTCVHSHKNGDCSYKLTQTNDQNQKSKNQQTLVVSKNV